MEIKIEKNIPIQTDNRKRPYSFEDQTTLHNLVKTMEVGDSFILPDVFVFLNVDGYKVALPVVKSMFIKHNLKFKTRNTNSGMRMWRVE